MSIKRLTLTQPSFVFQVQYSFDPNQECSSPRKVKEGKGETIFEGGFQ